LITAVTDMVKIQQKINILSVLVKIKLS